MGSPKLQALVVLVVVAVCSAAAGVAVDRLYLMRTFRLLPPAGEDMPPKILKAFDFALNLSPEQEQKILPIVRRNSQDLKVIWSTIQPTVEARIVRAEAEIRAELTPEQQEKFDKFKAKRPKNFNNMPPF